MIRIKKDDIHDFGKLFMYSYSPVSDLLLNNISEIPKRENLEEYVKFLIEGDKLGLI